MSDVIDYKGILVLFAAKRMMEEHPRDKDSPWQEVIDGLAKILLPYDENAILEADAYEKHCKPAPVRREVSADCEHEGELVDNKCPQCGAKFVACPGCSDIAEGHVVWHTEPACKQPTIPPIDKNCPSCCHSWDRHTGICHVISDCGGEECGCRKTRPMDGKGVELPMFDWERMAIIAVDELCAPDEHGVTEKCSACLAILGTRWALSMRETLQQAEQQRDGHLEERIKDLSEYNRNVTGWTTRALKAEAERYQAQTALAAEAWIEIKEGCKMPKHNEHVLAQHMAGYWTKWHFLRKFQGDFAKDCTHWRRITPPAGAVPKEKL